MMMRARFFSPAQFLAGIVQSPRQLHAAELRIDHDLDAVQRVALGFVIADVAVVGDGFPVVPFQAGSYSRIKLLDEAASRPSISMHIWPSGKIRSWLSI